MTGSPQFPASTRFPAIFQAAVIIGVTKRAIYRLVYAGESPASGGRPG